MRRSVVISVVAGAALVCAAAWLLLREPPPADPPSIVEPPAPKPVARPRPPSQPLAPPLAEAAPAPAPAAPDAGPSPEELAGPERKPPRHLPTRFTEPAVRDAVQAAIKEADSRGANVSSVDCTEHPCIFYVENVQPYDVKAIVKAPSLAAYRGESGFTACFPTIKSEGTGAGVCGLAYEPKLPPAEHEAALKRFRYRVEQMRDATR